MYISHPPSTNKLNDITIDGKFVVRLKIDLYMCPTKLAQISDHLFIGVIMGKFLVKILLQ